MKKNKLTFLSLLAFFSLSKMSLATDSAQSFEQLERQVTPIVKKPNIKIEKESRKITQNPSHKAPKTLSSHSEHVKNQECYQDAQGEDWCHDILSADTSNSVKKSQNDEQTLKTEISENTPSRLDTPASPKFKRFSKELEESIKKAQEMQNYAETASVRANNASVMALDSAKQALANKTNTLSLDFSGYASQTWQDGVHHEGEWLNGKAHGYGVRIWKDGKRYEGQWQEDKRNGYGVQTWPNGQKYQGEWQDDRKGAYGIYSWRDGQQYAGEFFEGNIIGFGIQTMPDGQRFVGAFADDLPNGFGVLYGASGAILKAGEWKDNEIANDATH